MSEELQGLVKTFYADPPWRYSSGPGRRGAADKHYPTLSLREIEEFKELLEFLRDPVGSFCYLWVPHSFLREGFDVMHEWGYKYITKIAWVKGSIEVRVDREDGELAVVPWVKLKKGMGGLFRGAHEDLFVGRRGKIAKNEGVGAIPDVIIAPTSKHSKKPKEAISLIEQMSPGPYFELFARELAPGWHGFGNELDNEENNDE